MSSAAQRQRYKRQQRQKQQAYQIQAWLKRFDLNRSGALEREELESAMDESAANLHHCLRVRRHVQTKTQTYVAMVMQNFGRTITQNRIHTTHK